MNDGYPVTTESPRLRRRLLSPPPGDGVWTVPWPFRDGAASRHAIGGDLSAIQADFARCLAMSAWAVLKPLRLLVFGLPMHASLDECLLATLRHAGRPVDALDDPLLDACWESRWEFVAATAGTPAHYRPGPSYHDRLRLELLLDAWERSSLRPVDLSLDPLAGALALASEAFAAAPALPAELLRRVAAERRADAEAERILRKGLRERLAELAGDDIRHLAIAGALDGWGDTDAAVLRYGTESMRQWMRQCRADAPDTSARAELEPLLTALRRELWAPFCAINQ